MILEPYLGDDTGDYEWRSMTFLQKVLTDRPAKWLPSAYKSYDELLAAAADRAVAKVSRTKQKRKPPRLGLEEIQFAGHAASHRTERHFEIAVQHYG